MRWLLIFVLVTLLINLAGGWLAQRGFGKLPGDLRLKIFKQTIHLPFTSTLLIGALIWLLSRLI